MVKAGEDDGELINPRDRSWPDVLYLAPALYILYFYSVLNSRFTYEVCIRLFIHSFSFSYLSLSSQYNATIGVH